MSYKKPQMVAKSVAKKSYVAGCPSNSGTTGSGYGTGGKPVCYNLPCEIYRKN